MNPLLSPPIFRRLPNSYGEAQPSAAPATELRLSRPATAKSFIPLPLVLAGPGTDQVKQICGENALRVALVLRCERNASATTLRLSGSPPVSGGASFIIKDGETMTLEMTGPLYAWTEGGNPSAYIYAVELVSGVPQP